MFDDSDEQQANGISNGIINNTDTNEVLSEDLPEPKFVVQDKSIKKLKITSNKIKLCCLTPVKLMKN